MKSYYNVGSARSLRELMMIAILAVIMAFEPQAFGQACVPVSGGAIVTNGIVFGAFGGVGPCIADQGWGGVIAKKFVSSGGGMGMNDPQILITGFDAGNNGTIDKIYVGVHVQVDQELTDLDKLLLVFDADGNGGAFNAPDFAILTEVGSNPLASGEQCDQTTGPVIFYKGAAMAQEALPAEAVIKVRRAWDYDPGNDPEVEIWEAEFELDVAALALDAPAAGDGFKLGARLIVTQSTNGTEIWRWPASFPNDANFTHFEPGSINPAITAANLGQASFGNCADVVFEPNGSTGVTAWNPSGEPNAFARLDPNNPQHFNQATGAALKQNHFKAVMKFFSPANPMDNSPVGTPNTGKVRFILKPYNMGFLPAITMAEMPVSFNQLNQIKMVELDWPPNKAAYQPHVANLDASEHACLEVRLANFTVNMNESSDYVQKNLIYTTASTIRDTIVVSAEGQRLPPGQDRFEYLFRARWRNLPKGVAAGWSFKIENAEKLGIKEEKNGYFRVTLGPKERKLVALAITGGQMPVVPVEFVVPPQAGGQHLPNRTGDKAKMIEVKPGKMITLISTGGIMVDAKRKEKQSGADGYSDSTLRKERFLLPAGVYDPSQNVGALIGSFDEFKTAFVIGTAMSFVVPKGADRLWLAVNDRDGGYADNRGNGFSVSMLMTEPLFLPTSIASTGGTSPGIPAALQVAANVPELDIEAFNVVRRKGEKGEEILLDPAGYVAFAVYQSHQEGKQPGGDPPDTTKPAPAPGCACAPDRPSGFMGFAPIFMLAGTAWLYRRSKRSSKDDRLT